MPRHREAGRALLEHQRGDRTFGVVDLAPLPEQQDAVRHVAAGDEDLAAIDHDLIAVRAEARAHAGRVRARIRLGDRQRAEPAFRDRGQQPLPLLLCAEIDQRLHAMEGGRVDDAGRGAGLADHLHCRDIEAEAHRRAAVGLRDKQPVQPERVQRLDVLPGELAAAVRVIGVRTDYVLTDAAHLIEHQPLVLAPVAPFLDLLEDLHQRNMPWPPSR